MKYYSSERKGRFCTLCKAIINPVTVTCKCVPQNELHWVPAMIKTTVRYRERSAVAQQIIDEITDGANLDDLSSDYKRALAIIQKYSDDI